MASVLSRLWLVGCSVVGYRAGTAEPAYRVVDQVGDVEIRRYDERLAADTVVSAADAPAARSAGFKILAGYIFGDNRQDTKIAMTAPVAQAPSSQKIAMTAPVSQAQTTDGWRIRFFLPSDLTLASAPIPNNDKVELTTAPSATYAVLRFSGSRRPSAVQARGETLEKTIASSRWQAAQPPVAWFYDPPWTIPFMRRNEVAVEVH
ncbi:MAG: heme-binding protein [Salinisphaera sp.]|jgi:hypothetical protein|nr:heme-binding protein [Salinisphaera sp.]